jgi:hypothetical protein
MKSVRRLFSSLGITLFLLSLTAMRPDGAVRAQENITLTRPIPGPVVPPPYFRTALENGTRSPDGSPGPKYWQVYSEYDIDARLDPVSGLLSGQETIRFHNRSPNALPVLQLFLHQNLHKAGLPRNRGVEITGGIRVERVKVGGEDLLPAPGLQAPGYRDMDEVMTIRLPEPLAPGATAELEIDWSFVVPQNGAGRMGHSNREMYFMAYWFPKIAVYDDLRGWDAEPYQGAEFYEGYGDYQVSLTVPNGWTVMAAGELLNPEQVYSPRTRAKMAAAAVADTMVRIATREDVESARVTELSESGSLTYRFRAENVRDFTWTTSNKQLWTGTSARVPDRDGDGQDDRVAIHSFYREYRAPLWEEQALYGKYSIEEGSRFTGFSYPWPHMTSVEGADIIGGGMEFPMFTLIGSYENSDSLGLLSVTVHELGHMWIPMIVGANEKRHAWIDEGATTFIENQVKKDYWPGIPDPDAAEMESYLLVARLEGEQSMMRHGDYYEPGPGYGTASYAKPASLLVTLRNLLGEEAFMEAYRTFISEWAYKHPSPWDFFNTFERVAGRDLDWFWTSFYYETWGLDQAVGSVTRAGDETVVTVRDLGFAFMPTMVRIEMASGEVLEREIPVSHWLTGAVSAEIRIPASMGEVVRVVIDPDGLFPDLNRENDEWVRG